MSLTTWINAYPETGYVRKKNLPENVQAAQDLHSKGYRVTSRKFRIVTRLDRPDWLEFMQENHCTHGGSDWYLRCLSKDKIYDVSPYILINMESSSRDNAVYIKEEVE